MKDIVLDENIESPDPVQLDLATRDALMAIAPKMRLRAAPGVGDHYYLTAPNFVGGLEVGDLRLTILPKLGTRAVLFMMSYGLDLQHWKAVDYPYQPDATVVEALAPGFVYQVERALRYGVWRDYQRRDEWLRTVRGRIQFGEQLRRRFGLAPPIACEFDDYTADVELNRQLRAATRRLLGLPFIEGEIRRELRSLDRALSDATITSYVGRRLPSVPFSRLNTHYAPAHQLARLILEGSGWEFDDGSVRARGMLVDLASVFERFLVVALRRALGLNEASFPQGASGRDLFLDLSAADPATGTIRLEPDFSWWSSGECVLIGDAKYKLAERSGDIYQLLAYLTATGLTTGVLVYSDDSPIGDKTIEIRGAPKRVLIRRLDLSGTPDEILERVTVLADELKAVRVPGNQLVA